jgi:hypothetical protein
VVLVTLQPRALQSVLQKSSLTVFPGDKKIGLVTPLPVKGRYELIEETIRSFASDLVRFDFFFLLFFFFIFYIFYPPLDLLCAFTPVPPSQRGLS